MMMVEILPLAIDLRMISPDIGWVVKFSSNCGVSHGFMGGLGLPAAW